MNTNPTDVLDTRGDLYIDPRGGICSIESGFTGQNVKDIPGGFDRSRTLYPCETCRCLYLAPVRVNAYGTPTCQFCR